MWPPLCVNRDTHKGRGAARPFPFPRRPSSLSCSPLPVACPHSLCMTGGTKKGGVHPLPFAHEPSPLPPHGTPFVHNRLRRNGCAMGAAHLLPFVWSPPTRFVRHPGPPFRTRWARRGVRTPLPIRACTPLAYPFPILPPFARRSCAQTRGGGRVGASPGLRAPFVRNWGRW